MPDDPQRKTLSTVSLTVEKEKFAVPATLIDRTCTATAVLHVPDAIWHESPATGGVSQLAAVPQR
jgi:hypothetical protein